MCVILYKFSVYNNREFGKVCQFCYNSFSGRFQVVKPGGIVDKTLNNIVYHFQTFIHYEYKVMIVAS